jgi:Bacteriophage replication gene A protein (GPA)
MARKHRYHDWAAHDAHLLRIVQKQTIAALPGQWAGAVAGLSMGAELLRNGPMRGADVQSWRARLYDFRERFGSALKWSMSDSDVCERAVKMAAHVDDILGLADAPQTDAERLDVVLMCCKSAGVPAPVALTAAGAVARAVSHTWWRRMLRKMIARVVEHGSIVLGLVHARSGAYASDGAVTRRVQQNARNAAMLEKTIFRNEAGQHFSLATLAKKSVANPAVRGGELMTRIRGCEEYAQECGHVGAFYTLSSPSRYHAMTAGARGMPAKNKRYDGVSTPRDAQMWLRTRWARVRAECARLGVSMYGFRVAEPHHDGTPHWHALLWFASDADAAKAEEVVRKHWLSDGGSEPGAKAHRVNCKRMRDGGAAGYIAKYIAKNIGHVDVGPHIDTVDGLQAEVCAGDVKGQQRVEAWASMWGIRQFQAIGQPPVSVWRELRRVTADQVEGARVDWRCKVIAKAAAAVHRIGDKQASWAGYIKAMGGVCLQRAGYALQCAKRVVADAVNEYGETINRKTVVGVVLPDGRWLVSRRQRWQRAAFAPFESASESAVRGAPWTRFNNCTARLGGTLRAAMLGIDRPNIYGGGLWTG